MSDWRYPGGGRAKTTVPAGIEVLFTTRTNDPHGDNDKSCDRQTMLPGQEIIQIPEAENASDRECCTARPPQTGVGAIGWRHEKQTERADDDRHDS